eukprot:jgi/Botrbrau1/4676/Bobra.33_2s0039.1
MCVLILHFNRTSKSLLARLEVRVRAPSCRASSEQEQMLEQLPSGRGNSSTFPQPRRPHVLLWKGMLAEQDKNCELKLLAMPFVAASTFPAISIKVNPYKLPCTWVTIVIYINSPKSLVSKYW